MGIISGHIIFINMTTTKILDGFRQRFGEYWSKVDDNVYIADPINNTKPIEDLKDGDVYWYVEERGEVVWSTYDGDKGDKWRVTCGNCFETGEAAGAYKAKILADYNNKL